MAEPTVGSLFIPTAPGVAPLDHALALLEVLCHGYGAVIVDADVRSATEAAFTVRIPATSV